MIKKFEEYINEDYFSKLASRKETGEVRKENNTIKKDDVNDVIDYIKWFLNTPEYSEDDYAPDSISWDEPNSMNSKVIGDSVVYLSKNDVKEPFCTVAELVSFIQGDMVVLWALTETDDEDEYLDIFYQKTELGLDEWARYILQDWGDNMRVLGACLFENLKSPYRESNFYFKNTELGKWRNKYNAGII